MDTIATQAAELLQTAHINRHPDPSRDINPSTAASKREPVTLAEDSDADSDSDEPARYTVRSRRAPKQQFPPIPDLRFEQSYLHSIEKAQTWWEVVFITVKDQLAFPLLQGFLWNITLCGWQGWNRNARIHGSSVGARARRWWYDVNNWKIPPPGRRAY